MPAERGFREVTWEWATTPHDYFIEIEEPEWQAAILARLEDVDQFPDVEGVIFFCDMELAVKEHRGRTVLPYGPNNTFKAEVLPLIKENPVRYRIGDVPSRFEYPQWYISRAAHLQAKHAART